jgi:hypothetical protein
MKIKADHIKFFTLVICLLFIAIDLFKTISTPYELLRIIFYGIAINILSDYITRGKKRGKK